jgi:hypothetical protein
LIGGAVDLNRSDTRQEAAVEAGFVLGRGKSAVIADVSEDWTTESISGCGPSVELSIVAQRASLQADADIADGFYPYDDYLYPYEYVPSRFSSYYGW